MTRTSERLILDALPSVVHATDAEGTIILANGSWRRFTRANGGAQPGEVEALLGRPIWEALEGITSREAIERAMETLRAGRAASANWEFDFGPREECRVGLLQATVLRDDRAIAGYLFVASDATVSRHAREQLLDAGLALARPITVERALQEMAQQLRETTACDAVAIALADLPGDPLALAHQAGFEQEGPGELTSSWNEARERGRIVSRHASRGLELTAPLPGEEGTIGVVTIIAEHLASAPAALETERALAAIAAQGAAAIERARQVRRVERRRRIEAVGDVATGVARELRNPLFGISSAAQLLRFRVRDDPVVETNVGRILREVERLNAMVTSLLEYSRPATPRLVAGDPDALWDQVLHSQRGMLQARALRVSRSHPRPPVSCRFDSEQLSQVFLNLLSNAVDAAPEGTDLTLASHRLPAGGWRCRLHNGGAPIPPESIPRLFELFFSGRPNRPGIGLALCQRIVEEHGGQIAIESETGGTTVTISLPAAPATVEPRTESTGQLELPVG